MNAGRRTRRRRTADAVSPTSGLGWFDFPALTLLSLAALLMAAIYGGTVFWASGIPYILGLLVVLSCQCVAVRQFGAVRLLPPPGTGAWLGLLGYVVLRAIFVPVIPYQVWTEALQMGAVLLFYITFSDLANRRKLWQWAIFLFLVFVAIQALYGLSLHIQGSRMVLFQERHESYGMRASGTFICPNHYAQLLQIGMILAAGLVLTPKLEPGLRLLGGFTFLVCLFPMFRTLSRAGWLGLVGGLGLIVFFKALRKGPLVTLLTAGGGAVLGFGLFRAFLLFSPLFRVRYERAFRDIRFTSLWPDTLRMIEAEGFWGAGPGMFQHVFERYRFHFTRSELYLRHAHNEYLHLLADYGWPGVVLVAAGMLWVVWVLARAALRASSETEAMVPTIMLAIFVGKALHAIFDFNAHINGNMTTFVMAMGILHGHGVRRGIWKAKPLPAGLSKVLIWITLVVTPVMIISFGVLAVGSLAERRMDAAHRDGNVQEEIRQAALMRRWTPFHWRGWTELGYHLRAESMFIRDPELRTEKVGESRAAYETALRWNPHDRIAWMGLAELAFQEEDYETAVEMFAESVRLDPIDAHVYVRYGLALRRVGDLESALQAFERADALRRNHRQTQLNLEYLRRQLQED